MINADVFREFSYGMYIVGSKQDNKKVGCIANSVMQITSQIPTIAISMNHDNYTNKVICDSNMFSISILSQSTKQSIIGTFGFSTSLDNDKWKTVEHTEFEGMPVLNSCCGYVVCKVIDKMETQTHTIFVRRGCVC